MSNATAEEFRRSLDQLVQQAQHTAQLGFNVAKEQVEGLIKNPPNDQLDEVRRNLQTMAREMETKAQELVHLASSYMQPGGGTATGSRPRTTVTQEPPAAHESATGAGAGTAQEGSDRSNPTPTPGGEAPGQ